MNLYILPVQRVLLEYVLKLGDMIFSPGDVSNEAIEYSNLLDDEKEKLRLIVEHNRSFFTEQLTGLPFLLLSSKYDISEINNDITIFEKILNDANRRFDYIRILECPFNRPEYTIGIPGLIDGKRILFSINDDYSIGAYINGEEEFYLMQKGIGLDLGVTENNDTRLYRVIYSHRNDEVYNLYRRYIAEACEALQIIDETRCFIFLFSKIDGMGLCDTYSFTDILNGEVLPPRVGLRTGIRAIYEFVEDKEELFLQFVPGRVFSEYQIPSEAYNCIKLYKDDIYEILFGNANYIDNLCKRSLVNICESEYVRDWTQRISYLFDTFDGIDPRNYNKEKVIKLVFTILAIDKADYLRNKQKYEQLKNKYRNPILNGGKSIFEIEPDINEIKKVDTYLRKTIMDYCLKIHSLSISTWEELDNAYRVQQNFLKL